MSIINDPEKYLPDTWGAILSEYAPLTVAPAIRMAYSAKRLGLIPQNKMYNAGYLWESCLGMDLHLPLLDLYKGLEFAGSWALLESQFKPIASQNIRHFLLPDENVLLSGIKRMTDLLITARVFHAHKIIPIKRYVELQLVLDDGAHEFGQLLNQEILSHPAYEGIMLRDVKPLLLEVSNRLNDTTCTTSETKPTKVTRERLQELRTMPYQAYLASPEWQTRRTIKLEQAAYKCQLCGCQNRTLAVHHNTYERRGNELDSDLVVLCAHCHAKFHDKEYAQP